MAFFDNEGNDARSRPSGSLLACLPAVPGQLAGLLCACASALP